MFFRSCVLSFVRSETSRSVSILGVVRMLMLVMGSRGSLRIRKIRLQSRWVSRFLLVLLSRLRIVLSILWSRMLLWSKFG